MFKPLVALVILLATGGLAAQEGRDTLVVASRWAASADAPLTRIAQLIPGDDGSVFLLDALAEGVLAFGPDGAFRGQIGRQGEGPGELLAPWRIGLLGPDTLWVVDAQQPRVNLYDAESGASLRDFGPATWLDAMGDGARPNPFAMLAGHGVVMVSWLPRDTLAELRTLRLPDRDAAAPVAGGFREVLDVRERLAVASVPDLGGGLQMRNPFSHSDMIAIGPRGRRVAIIRRPRPDGSSAFFTVEHRDVLEDTADTIRVPYTPHPIPPREIRAWAEDLEAVERMVQLDVFPSRTSVVEALLESINAPDHYPPVDNRGSGIVDEGVLLDPGGGIWLQAYDPSGRANEWIVISGEGGDAEVSRVGAPEGVRLLAVRGDRVWAEARDAFGVPTVQVLRVQPSRR